MLLLSVSLESSTYKLDHPVCLPIGSGAGVVVVFVDHLPLPAVLPVGFGLESDAPN